MSDDSLRVLAAAVGLQRDWIDAQGRQQRLGDATLLRLLTALGIPADTNPQRMHSLAALREAQRQCPAMRVVETGAALHPPPGGDNHMAILRADGSACGIQWHRGRWMAPDEPGYYTWQAGRREGTLAVTPRRCFGVADAVGPAPPRAWGLAAQIYALRRDGDGGIGDSSAVAQLSARIGCHGGDALALSPLHALAIGTSSPYYPSHRGYLNWMLADPSQVLGVESVRVAITEGGMGAAWDAAGDAALIDWPATSSLRRKLWRRLHAMLPAMPAALQRDLEEFALAGGDALQAYADFTARRAHEGPGSPPPAGVDGVAFEVFAQWLAQRAWTLTAQAARSSGLGLGLITDLAVGFDPGGSEAAAHAGSVLRGLTLGAPPDAFNTQGQDWGITSYTPQALGRGAYAPFLAALRANMRLGGGLRLDHILGLSRLWVIPQGSAAAEGGYLRYPLHDLLGLLALESWRHRCVIIGEDLGTVPDDLRAILAARGVLGIDVLLFNREQNGAFRAPRRWRSSAVAMTTTHDLPPLAGWRRGSDLAWRARIDQPDPVAIVGERQERERDVQLLDAAAGPAPDAPAHPAGVDWAALRFTARSAAPLMLLPLEDALGLREQPNLPGTTDQHPNWRRRLPAGAVDALGPAMDWIHRARREGEP